MNPDTDTNYQGGDVDGGRQGEESRRCCMLNDADRVFALPARMHRELGLEYRCLLKLY